MREVVPEVERAASHWRHPLYPLGDCQILHVPQRNASRILREQRVRILVSEDGPVEVHLEVHERRIGLAHQDVVPRAVAVHLRELGRMIVIGEADAGITTHRAPLVEFRGSALPRIDAAISREWIRRERDVLLPDYLRGPDLPRRVLPHQLRTDVRTRRDEREPVEDRPHLLGRAIVVAGELHVRVADRGHLRECPVEIFLEQVANGVELQADMVHSGWSAAARECARARGHQAGAHADCGHLVQKRPPAYSFLLVALAHGSSPVTRR